MKTLEKQLGIKKCICACHSNQWNSSQKREPLEHDTKCCDKMNGYIPNEQIETLQIINEALKEVNQNPLTAIEWENEKN